MKSINYSILFCAVSVAITGSANATDVINLAAKTHKYQPVKSRSMYPGFSSQSKNVPTVQLDNGISFKQTNVVNLPNGEKQFRLQQYYKGIPIFGYSIVSSILSYKNIINDKVFGKALTHFNQNEHFTKPDITAKHAINLAVKSIEGATQVKVKNIKEKLFIYPDGNTPKLAYMISFIFPGIQPQRPVTFVNAHSGEIIDQWNSLNNEQILTSGLGGNANNEIEYHSDTNGIPIMRQGDECYFDSEHVRTIDLNHQGYIDNAGIHEPSYASDEPISFNCQGNEPYYSKQFEGTYGLANDAQYFGEKTYEMYDKWFQTTPINGNKLLMRIHFADHMDNAFWDGTYMNFGDGDGQNFYPFVTLDITAHEISHGFTEKDGNSGLIGGKLKNCESCAMNESFSDMAGEAAKYFTNGENDYHHGEMAIRNNLNLTKANRYMDDPTQDGRSIENYLDYTPDTEVHAAAGIYDKAFYILAKQDGWGVKKAFSTFVLANRSYWNPNTGFEDGACGVLAAAKKLKNNTHDVSSAFADVGISNIDLNSCHIN